MERKRIQRDLDAMIKEIHRLNVYYDKEREFLFRPKVGRPHPNTWHDPDIKAFEARQNARIARMEETSKKISALCCEREALKATLEKNPCT